jgi:hypothetical protein
VGCPNGRRAARPNGGQAARPNGGQAARPNGGQARCPTLHAKALWFALLAVVLAPRVASAQLVTTRGFAETLLTAFPQDTASDATNIVGDLLVRDDVFVKPAAWLQFAAGGEARANSHDQVDASWRIDFTDRGTLRPALSIRRLAATVSRGALTVDVGKQFIRWGKTDIVTPADRFAPRDFVNVTSPEFLGVTGVRLALQRGVHAFEGVWLPYLTPSRTPILGQRWTQAQAAFQQFTFRDVTSDITSNAQIGARYSHTGERVEYSLSVFDGNNHLPNVRPLPLTSPTVVDVVREYPTLRSYGADAAIPTSWFIVKAEAAYFTTTTPQTDEYVLYVVQLERQVGEWQFVGGYAGQHVTERQANFAFAPDRGLTEAVVSRAAYTIGPTRSASVEGAVRTNGDGLYVKGEYSQAYGAHWRATITGTAIAGDETDFLGQYHDNSHVALALRYSF